MDAGSKFVRRWFHVQSLCNVRSARWTLEGTTTIVPPPQELSTTVASRRAYDVPDICHDLGQFCNDDIGTSVVQAAVLSLVHARDDAGACWQQQLAHAKRSRKWW